MNIVDIIILLFLITSVMRGIELGLLRQVGIAAGTIIGLFIGIFLQGLLSHITLPPLTKVLLTIMIISTLMLTFSALGDQIMHIVKSRLQSLRPLKILDVLDKIAGVVVSVATLALVIWLAAAICMNVQAANLGKYVGDSLIVRQLNQRLPAAPSFTGRVSRLLNTYNFPTVFVGLEPSIKTDTPLPSIGALDPAVQATRASVVKVEGDGCGGVSEGSGFVADNGLVITNAHVVAGIKRPFVMDANGNHAATPLWFDPNLDLAILRVSNLKGGPLYMQIDFVHNNTQAAALGYPGGKSLNPQPAVVLDTFEAVGQNIYNQGQTKRSVYAFKADVEPGNSGGPLIDSQGRVIGVVFAKSTSYDMTGYALTANQAITSLNQAKQQNQPVSTGTCRQ